MSGRIKGSPTKPSFSLINQIKASKANRWKPLSAASAKHAKPFSTGNIQENDSASTASQNPSKQKYDKPSRVTTC